MPSVEDRLKSDDLVFDSVVVSHGYAENLRDYQIVIDKPEPLPSGVPVGDSTGFYLEGRYRYTFTHCVEARVGTSVRDEIWRESWDDLFLSHEAWQAAGKPEGFGWWAGSADAYPGLSYVAGSEVAKEWSSRLRHDMHEIILETNVFTLRLIFHVYRVEKTWQGDPTTQEVMPLDPILRVL
jgi:hypothetical protein